MMPQGHMKVRITGSDIKHYSNPAPVTDEEFKQWGLSFLAGALFGGFIVMLLIH